MSGRRLLPLTLVFVAVGALGLAGCGGGGDGGDSGASVTATSTTPSSGTTPSGSTAPLVTIAEELEADGMSVWPEDPGQGAEEAITVGPRSNQRWVNVEYFGDSQAAAKAGNEIEAIYTEAVGQGLVQVEGQFLVEIGSEENLSADEEQAFLDVLEVVEGTG